MLRILHFADLHLERPFGSIATTGRPGNLPRELLRRCLERMVDLALERKADAITLGGDLFEHEHFTAGPLQFVQEQFRRLGSIPVFISPGNHDPAMAGSPYRQEGWPQNIRVARSPGLEPFPLDDSTCIWASAFTSPVRRDCPIAGFRVPQDGRRHILLLHADLGKDESDYCPLPLPALQGAGFGLALLGHLHGAQCSLRHPFPVLYPGSPCPLDFSEEEDEHAAVLVELDGEHVRWEALDVATLRLRTVHLDITGISSFQELVALARGAVDAAGPVAAVRLVLEGELSFDVDLRQLIERLAATGGPFVDVRDRTLPALDLDAEAQGRTARSRFVRRMLERIRTAGPQERPVLEEALRLGIAALEGRELEPAFWRAEDEA
mgnify:CR=1 FL=1